jgi:phasin
MAMKSTGFEIPPEMKAFAEQSIEAARKAFDSYLVAANKAFGAVGSSSAATQAGASDLGRKAMGFAQENVAATFAFIDELMRAKDAGEVMRLQAEFTKAQMQKLGEQTKALGEVAAKTAGAASKPRA